MGEAYSSVLACFVIIFDQHIVESQCRMKKLYGYHSYFPVLLLYPSLLHAEYRESRSNDGTLHFQGKGLVRYTDEHTKDDTELSRADVGSPPF